MLQQAANVTTIVLQSWVSRLGSVDLARGSACCV